MAKFKCIENSRDFVEVVRDKEGRPALTVGDNHSASVAFFAPSDAPALCLAILEAAKVPMQGDFNNPIEGTAVHLSFIAQHLERYVVEAEERAAAEADRAALEQEALKLYNAGRKHQCMVNDATWDDLNTTTQKYWLAVARAARELNKEVDNA